MNRDSEAIQRRLLNLLQELIPTANAADAEAVGQAMEFEMVQPSPSNPNHASTPPDVNRSPSSYGVPGHSPVGESLIDLGEIPAVQERFQALIKRRLQTEIERHPPLFPWETEIYEYDRDRVAFSLTEETASEVASQAEQLRSPEIWLRHLGTLNLPVQVPTGVLTQLLERCQASIQSSLKEGARLVHAVEDLFPGQSDALNYLAGMVMATPSRSSKSAPPTGLPSHYEAAVPAQQMVLSLLAAREIVTALTLTVSVDQPTVERQWLTELGALALQVTYDPHTNANLRVQATVPCRGILTLRSDGAQTIARRPNPGELAVEVFGTQPNQSYVLEVQLSGQNQVPLLFTIQVTE